MPLIHERPFRVRYYECDAFGHLNNASYLHYLQEAAFDATAAAGYGLDHYRAQDRYWLTRQVEIEYLVPARYGDTVVVQTWAEGFRGVRSRRVFAFFRASDQTQVARAFADYVFMDAGTNRPTAIPEEMLPVFFPEGPPENPSPRTRFPAAPPPPPGVFKLRRRVEWRDIDDLGVVNNAVYLSYVDDCGDQVANAFGWPMSRWAEGGFGFVVRQHQIEYLGPARLGDELELATWVSNVRSATAIRHYTIRTVPDNQLITQVHTRWVWVDPESGRPVRIPQDFLTDFATNIVPND